MDTKPKTWKLILVGICAGILLTGTLAVASPSVAAAPVSISKIWKAIKKKADKRYYKKAASDAKYAPRPKVLRGVVALPSTPIGGFAMSHIDFGVTLDAAPTQHIIAPGGAVPAGCSGTPAAPSASPGHLCIFEQATSGFGARLACSAVNACNATSRFGAFYFANSTSATGYLYGSWALGIGSSTTARLAPSTDAGSKGGSPGSD